MAGLGKGYFLKFFLGRMILLLNILVLVIYNQSKSHGQYTLHDNLAVHRIFGWEIYPGILIGNFWKEFTIYKPGNQETVPTEYLQTRETIIHLKRQWYFLCSLDNVLSGVILNSFSFPGHRPPCSIKLRVNTN